MPRSFGLSSSALCRLLPASRPAHSFPMRMARHWAEHRSMRTSGNPSVCMLDANRVRTVQAIALGHLRRLELITDTPLRVGLGHRYFAVVRSPDPSFRRSFMSTKSGSPGSGPAEGSQELLLTKPPPDGGLVLEQHGERSVSVPSLRVVEIDVDEMDKHTKAMIRRNNFYGKILLVSLLVGGVLMYIFYAASDVSSGLLRHMDGLLEVLYRLLPENLPDPETAHRAVMWLAARGYLPLDLDRDDPALSVNVKGLTFHTPVGLAAGFDKHAEAPLGFCKMGFGFVEVGSITPRPQDGNPKPRLFRLPKDNAIINRCGFNSAGLDVVEPRLKHVSRERWEDRLARRCVIGINLGKNKDTEHAEEDIREGVKRIGRFADYLVINLSSPNTKGLRALQQRDHLKSIITTAQAEIRNLEESDNSIRGQRKEEEKMQDGVNEMPEDLRLKGSDFFPTQTGRRPLLFVKIAPDLTDQEKRDIADVALETNLDGLVVTNTTIQRPESLKSRSKSEAGGLSGRPLKAMATKCVSDMYTLTKGQVAIIASGGIESGLDAFERIKAGASVVEVYTSMIYRGPIVARRIKDELLAILNQAGIYNVQDAIGMDHRPPKKTQVRKPSFD